MPQVDIHPPRAIAPALLAATMLLPSPLRAQEVSATGQASARLIRPLILASLADLDFGLVRTSLSQDGSVIVSATGGSASFTGGARPACEGAACPSPHPAAFSVSGEPGRTYAVSIAPVLAISAATPGGRQLEVGRFTVSTLSRGNEGHMGLLDASGRDEFRIGGTLTLPSGLAPARYRRSLPVTVSYE